MELYDSQTTLFQQNIQNPNLCFLFLIQSIACITLGCIFLYFTIRILLDSSKSKCNITSFLFYASFHVNLVTSSLYFLAASNYYDIFPYIFLSKAFYLWQDIRLLCIIINFLESILSLDNCSSNKTIKFIFGLLFLYIIFFIIIFEWESGTGQFKYFYLYTFFCEFIFDIWFFQLSKVLYSEIMLKYPSLMSFSKRHFWHWLIVTILFITTARIFSALLNYLGAEQWLKSFSLVIYIVAKLLSSYLFDMLPCVVIIFLMNTQISKIVKYRTINEILNELDRKKICFIIQYKETLMEEIVDENGIEDNQ